jgi:hypothetical protein
MMLLEMALRQMEEAQKHLFELTVAANFKFTTYTMLYID